MKIKVWKSECPLCGFEVHDVDKEKCKEKLNEHIENCDVKNKWEKMEEQGILNDYFDIIIKCEAIKSLERLMKKFNLCTDEIRSLLKDIEVINLKHNSG